MCNGKSLFNREHFDIMYERLVVPISFIPHRASKRIFAVTLSLLCICSPCGSLPTLQSLATGRDPLFFGENGSDLLKTSQNLSAQVENQVLMILNEEVLQRTRST